ncbi:MAG: Holliday junction branch migration protein RuvA [Candidatus Coproplasma sp.]
MIGYLKGKVLNITAETALILVGGVGYEVYCSGSAFSKMTQGQECEVYTYLQVSEQNGVTLYGFSDIKEKEMFLKLISVSGVGPKIGLAVLTYMDAGQVASAIATSDVKALSSVKGLGKKTAERLILELKDSVASMPVMPIVEGAPAVTPSKVSGEDEDAIVALTSLGFSRAEAERAVIRAKNSGAKTVEEVIMTALKGM